LPTTLSRLLGGLLLGTDKLGESAQGGKSLHYFAAIHATPSICECAENGGASFWRSNAEIAFSE